MLAKQISHYKAGREKGKLQNQGRCKEARKHLIWTFYFCPFSIFNKDVIDSRVLGIDGFFVDYKDFTDVIH